jgi:hypothetical protein
MPGMEAEAGRSTSFEACLGYVARSNTLFQKNRKQNKQSKGLVKNSVIYY